MSTEARPTPLSASLPKTMDGYDFDAETRRAKASISDATAAGHSLNRATARIRVVDDPAEWDGVRKAHRDQVLPNTLDPDSPVVELGWPTSGHYVMSSRGVEIDLMLGVAQKIVDDRHPAVLAAVS